MSAPSSAALNVNVESAAHTQTIKYAVAGHGLSESFCSWFFDWLRPPLPPHGTIFTTLTFGISSSYTTSTSSDFIRTHPMLISVPMLSGWIVPCTP